MKTFFFDVTNATADTIYFVNDDTDVAGYVTIDPATGEYTIDRFVDEDDNTVDYMMDDAELSVFHHDIEPTIAAHCAVCPIEAWDSVYGVGY